MRICPRGHTSVLPRGQRRRCRCPPYGLPLPDRQHHVEPRPQCVVRGGDLHHQLGMEEVVDAVLRLVGKVELGGQQRPVGRLDFDVIVAGAAAGVERPAGMVRKL